MKFNLINIVKNIAKSVILGTVVSYIFLLVFSNFINSGDAVGAITCIAVISVQFFCTFIILDAVKSNKTQ
ncbi:membrane protein [Clostridium acetobutylicum]|nr:membrane protein [Clostridium acetobutylicum]